MPVAGFGSDAGELLDLPARDLILVTVSRLEPRFLESPAQSLIEDFPIGQQKLWVNSSGSGSLPNV